MFSRSDSLSRPHRPFLVRLLGRLGRLDTIRRERAALARLDDHALRDIGLAPDEARTEAARPLWDAPDRWRR